MYKMVVITIEKCKNVKVDAKPGDGELFWVKMNDVQKGLCIKNMSDLVRKELHGIFETNNPTEEQIKRYKLSLREITNKSLDDSKSKYVRSDLMAKILKNCRGVKQCKNDIAREEKEKKTRKF